MHHVASPKHDLDTMFQYISFIPIHKPMLTLLEDRSKLFGITKIIFAFAYNLQHPTVNMLVIQMTNYYVMYVTYQLSDIGLYLLLSKFVVRIQTVEPRSSYMDSDQHFTTLIQTTYDV